MSLCPVSNGGRRFKGIADSVSFFGFQWKKEKSAFLK
jgi:hypothetical protein